MTERYYIVRGHIPTDQESRLATDEPLTGWLKLMQWLPESPSKVGYILHKPVEIALDQVSVRQRSPGEGGEIPVYFSGRMALNGSMIEVNGSCLRSGREFSVLNLGH